MCQYCEQKIRQRKNEIQTCNMVKSAAVTTVLLLKEVIGKDCATKVGQYVWKTRADLKWRNRMLDIKRARGNRELIRDILTVSVLAVLAGIIMYVRISDKTCK